MESTFLCQAHLRREDFGVGQEVMAEHFDDKVELSQVLTLLRDLEPHQVVVRELTRGRRLLCALRHQTDVVLLVEHVHQHLRADNKNQSEAKTHTQTRSGDV